MNASIPYFQSAANATKRLVQAGFTTVHSVHITNPNTVSLFLQIFDANAAADVTLGTTAPNFVIAIPEGTSATLVGGVDKDFPAPLRLSLGYVWAITTTATGATGPTSDCTLSSAYS